MGNDITNSNDIINAIPFFSSGKSLRRTPFDGSIVYRLSYVFVYSYTYKRIAYICVKLSLADILGTFQPKLRC